ncbi:apolipoprotein N-acyltransferase [Thalassolituus sp. LLYu03]|uniref:apolipoprotein N-acyltransferase n=1 Tax=Thalassolituus sp. LLYu03 TaxID=3421656 RepID=UPI003D2C2AF6
MNPWIIRLIMLVAGALFPLALAPFFWWPVALLSLLPFVIAQSTARSARQAFSRAWWFGLGQFGVGVSWIYVSMHDHGGTPAFLAIPMVAVFAGFLALFPSLWFALRVKLVGQTLAGLTIPVFWFLQEWCRSWFMTGFPWLFAGDAHLDTWLAGWAPVIGSYGISFILLLSTSGLWFAARQRRLVWLLPLLFWPAGLILQSQEWTHTTGELNVAAVQGNIPQDKKWLREWISPTINAYYQQTSEHWDADLILWPETAMTLLLDQFQPYQDEMANEARDTHTTIVTGIPYRYPRGTPLAGEFHNSVVAFGNGEGMYHKQRLVPFGEYVPFEKQIRGLLPFFDLAMSSFLEGAPDQALLKVGRHTESGDELYLIAPFICYEIAYPDLVNRMAVDADFLVTVSNDAWFGDSLGPKQHMALARMRALETGRWLLRSTNTGITALVDNKGQMKARLPYEVRDTLTGTAEMRQGQTPYMQAGLWPLYGISALILLAAFIRQYRQREWKTW